MIRAQILTHWTGTGTEEDPNRYAIWDDFNFTPSEKCEDVTGQPSANLHPDPNMFIVQMVLYKATLTAIEADPKYRVLWSEEIIEFDDEITEPVVIEKPTEVEFDNLKAHLIDRGLIPNIGATVNKRTKKQIAAELITQLKMLPKAKKIIGDKL